LHLKQNLSKIINSGYQWIWQTGSYYYEDVNALVSVSGASDIKVFGFITRMDYAFAAADVVVSRAGAGTISELCLVGKPVILVPSPNVAEDHQTRNALSLSEKGAAILVKDAEAVNRLVDEALKLADDESRKKSLSENIAALAEKDTDIRIAREVIKLVRE